jgi:hypothetical protein
VVEEGTVVVLLVETVGEEVVPDVVDEEGVVVVVGDVEEVPEVVEGVVLD